MLVLRSAALPRCARSTLFALLCGAFSGVLIASESTDVLTKPAMLTPQAQQAVLLGVARAGERLVSVGERGVILLSDDDGVTWRQVTVPVSATLTAVQFVDERHGWAVGHAGVVLHSSDGGESWAVQLDGNRAAAIELGAAQTEQAPTERLQAAELLVDDGADKPLLALHFNDLQTGVVVGAYGLALQTTDGGQSWQSIMGRVPNPAGAHLYAVSQRGNEWYLAGEMGLAVRSLDGGATFEQLQTPYEGSFFAQGILPGGELVLAGLRGTVLMSRDRGESFEQLSNPMPISINAAMIDGGQLMLANQAGGLLRVFGSGQIKPMGKAGSPLAAIVEAGNGRLVGVGFAGAVALAPLDPTTAHASAE
ncbi:WD40/YVTN/BNR-like repeat-containing protein [Stutzerimonas stutzeri]|uniref:WD40/YVTN/BNR-like repeat-containing protein n=1 Tax=Stutzerimonas stutzeri TaxID=316 RepID=UPI00147DED19|nr:YCF48-related protein [Stutzerimonas stutzeri]WRQ02319.1 YCF48-related protein [Stutzerimonas stutzeri]